MLCCQSYAGFESRRRPPRRWASRRLDTMATSDHESGVHEVAGRTVTMQDIARLSGVSQSTVSRILNDVVTAVPIAAAHPGASARGSRAPRVPSEPVRPSPPRLKDDAARDDRPQRSPIRSSAPPSRRCRRGPVSGATASFWGAPTAAPTKRSSCTASYRPGTVTASSCSATWATNHAYSSSSLSRRSPWWPCGRAVPSKG